MSGRKTQYPGRIVKVHELCIHGIFHWISAGRHKRSKISQELIQKGYRIQFISLNWAKFFESTHKEFNSFNKSEIDSEIE